MGDDSEMVSEIRSFLVSSPKGVPLSRILKEYKELTGERIQYHKYGSVESFLKTIPDVYFETVNGEKIVKARPSESSSHVAKLIREQRNSTTKSNKGRNHGGRSRNRGSNFPLTQQIESWNNQPSYCQASPQRNSSNSSNQSNRSNNFNNGRANSSSIKQSPTTNRHYTSDNGHASSSSIKQSPTTNRHYTSDNGHANSSSINQLPTTNRHYTSNNGHANSSSINHMPTTNRHYTSENEHAGIAGSSSNPQLPNTNRSYIEMRSNYSSQSSTRNSSEVRQTTIIAPLTKDIPATSYDQTFIANYKPLFQKCNEWELSSEKQENDLGKPFESNNRPLQKTEHKESMNYVRDYNDQLTDSDDETDRNLVENVRSSSKDLQSDLFSRKNNASGPRLNDLRSVVDTSRKNDLQELDFVNIEHLHTFTLREEKFGLKAPSLPAEGEYTEFFVNDCVDPYNISMQPFNCLDDLTNLCESMNQFYNNTSCTPMPETSGLCAIQSGDTDWYRGFIKRTNNYLASVYFCDFGHEIAVDVRQLRPLHRKFQTLPFLGLHCKLHGIKSINIAWSASDRLKLRRTLLGKKVYVSLKEVVERYNDSNFSTLSVSILEFVDNKITDIACRMVAEKRAITC